jgi:glucokinase
LSAPFVLGVDIGGTNLVVGAVSRDGRLAAIRSEPTRPDRGPDAAVAAIQAMASALAEDASGAGSRTSDAFMGMGVGCPGPLDPEGGIILETPNLGWEGFPILDRLAEAIGLPATLDNDANCATWGEWWAGAGRGAGSLVCVTLGTGVGGGFIADGRLLRGASGAAMEIGHTTLSLGGRLCGCGARGCLEAYVSGPAIAARAREAVDSGEVSILASLVDGDLNVLTAAHVHEAFSAGDDLAVQIVEETASILGAGLGSLINVLNPERIAIVGGVAALGDDLFRPLREHVRDRVFPSTFEVCAIVPGELRSTAGVIGAAGRFLQERDA